jgi:hypothetical protein
MIDGKELMDAVNMESGPMVGYLLEAIREAQVNHEVSDKDEAINLAKKILLENTYKKTG